MNLLNNPSSRTMYWLKRAYIAVGKAMDEALAEHDLTAAQMQVLGAVAQSEGIEHRELLEWMGVSSPTLTNLVDKLVEHGYLERRISPQDARVKLLYLTDASRELHQKMFSFGEQAMQALLKGFTPGEITMLGELLERLAANAGDAGDFYCHR